MMKVSAVVASLGMLITLSGCSSFLSGRVVDQAGHPVTVPDGRVNVTRLQEPVRSVVVPIDQKGAFEVPQALPEGRYLVESLIPGFETASKSIVLDGKKPAPIVMKVKASKTARVKSIDMNSDVDMSRGAGGALITPPQL